MLGRDFTSETASGFPRGRGVSLGEVVDQVVQGLLDVVEGLPGVDSEYFHRARVFQFDQSHVAQAPDGVVDPGLWNVGGFR